MSVVSISTISNKLPVTFPLDMTTPTASVINAVMTTTLIMMCYYYC